MESKIDTAADDQTSSLTARLYKSPSARNEVLSAYDRLLREWQADYVSRFIPTEFGETHVIESASTGATANPNPLLLIPGGQGTAGMWGPVIPILGKTHRIFCVDLIDQVGRCRPERVLKSAQDASDWIAQTLDGLELQQVSVMGNSIGSYMAANFALKYPHRINRLVLTAPAATFAQVRLGYVLRVLIAMASPLRRSSEKFVARTANYRGDPNSPLNKLLVSAMHGTRVISQLTPSRLSLEAIEAWSTPTLAVFGECDDVNDGTSAETIEQLAKVAPTIRTTMIPDAGHLFTTDDFVACAGSALAFLSEET